MVEGKSREVPRYPAFIFYSGKWRYRSRTQVGGGIRGRHEASQEYELPRPLADLYIGQTMEGTYERVIGKVPQDNHKSKFLLKCVLCLGEVMYSFYLWAGGDVYECYISRARAVKAVKETEGRRMCRNNLSMGLVFFSLRRLE